MKVKVHIGREIEVEVNSPAVEKLDEFYRTHHIDEWNSVSEDMLNEAIRAMEQVVGLPFGDDNAKETIVAVYAMDDNAILEW